jgi:hypothetical protein
MSESDEALESLNYEAKEVTAAAELNEDDEMLDEFKEMKQNDGYQSICRE